MRRSEDDLRAFYADQPADPTAEQRLAERFTGTLSAPPRRGAHRAQHWLVAAAAAASVLVAASLSVAGAWARHRAADPAPHPVAAGVPSPSRSPDGPATVPITPQVVAHTLLLDLLPPGGRTSDLRGATHPGLVSALLRYGSRQGSALLRVDVCLPGGSSGPQHCPLLPGPPNATRHIDGSVVVFGDGPVTGVAIPASPTSNTGSIEVSARLQRFVSARRPDGVQVIVTEVAPGGLIAADLPLASHTLVDIATSDRWRARVPAAVAAAAASLFVPDEGASADRWWPPPMNLAGDGTTGHARSPSAGSTPTTTGVPD